MNTKQNKTECCELCRENPPSGDDYCTAKGCKCHAPKTELSACCNKEAMCYNYLPDFPKCSACGKPFVPKLPKDFGKVKANNDEPLPKPERECEHEGQHFYKSSRSSSMPFGYCKYSPDPRMAIEVKEDFEKDKKLMKLIEEIKTQARKDAIEDYLKSEEGKIYQDYKTLERQAYKEGYEEGAKLGADIQKGFNEQNIMLARAEERALMREEFKRLAVGVEGGLIALDDLLTYLNQN